MNIFQLQTLAETVQTGADSSERILVSLSKRPKGILQKRWQL